MGKRPSWNGATSLSEPTPQWGNFSIGADAAVEFKSTVDGFNSLNYVTGANALISEIYGQLTALGGNIFIANPAGVQIGNSAQINVGSLYVTNKDVGDAVNYLSKTSEESDIISAINTHGVAETNAELMSLGAITNATNVTFDGARIVLDTDRIYTANGDTGELEQVNGDWFETGLDIITTDKDNVVLGSSERANIFTSFSINGNNDTLEKGYTWVHNIDELQEMNENTNGWYALRNSIDANATADGFSPIGNGSNPFTGRFDGLGYSIFGLNVKEDTDAAGLFGFATYAHIKNFTLNGGSISGGKYVGAAVGSASGGVIENITNTASVSGIGTGEGGIGGIVGHAGDTTMSGLKNIGTIKGDANSENVGGIVGYMMDGSLTGESYNLGGVTGGHNVGGIVGQAANGAQIGSDSFQIFNQLNVTGDYNVGGIAGTLSSGTITNAANHGNVLAKGYTTETYSYHTVQQSGVTDTKIVDREDVNVANVGGIAGETKDNASISDVINDGDVTSTRAEDGDKQYIAGNVGGIVGRAENTSIENAENKENTVAGAHNVGGVAGFLGGTSKIDTGLNNGGDITGTGARTDNPYTDDYYAYNEDTKDWEPQQQDYIDGYVRERVRPYGRWNENEIFIVGNIGGIAGYIYGDGAQITNSGNRGTVHSELIGPNTSAGMVPESAKAANVGGVVGKISQSIQDAINTIKGSPESATVYNSYNTGEVQGYTGVGGVVGSMYNGSIAGSYNLGNLRSTRQASAGSLDPLNMGGVVGDTTEDAGANAVIYDVYNAGTIGDADYEYYGRHVGGVVGRLSGTLEKSYNTGDVYNGYSTVGGVAGWWYSGNITNVFNTGNVTVRVDSTEDNARTDGSQVGGIIGASSGNGSGKSLTNAYNLGTIRSFAVTNPNYDTTLNSIGGIIGNVQGAGVTSIKNVYTTNNLYAATATGTTEAASYTKHNNGLGAVYGRGNPKTIENAYYVEMYGNNSGFVEPSTQNNVTPLTPSADTHLTEDDFDGFTFVHQIGAGLDTADPNFEDSWRIYNGTMPILNAFLPNSEEYFSGLNNDVLSDLGIAENGIQYGTAANPLLTVINAKPDSNVTLDWEALGSRGNASFAVYGGGLTLDKFDTGTGYYRGTLYADGALTVNGTEGEPFNLGSSANLYGTDVKIYVNGDATIYGNVTSTNGSVYIEGDNIDVLGKLTSSEKGAAAAPVKNIAQTMPTPEGEVEGLDDPHTAVATVSDAYSHQANGGKNADIDGEIYVDASGSAEILYGNMGMGEINASGGFTVDAGESIYIDSPLHIEHGDLTLNSKGEIIIDFTETDLHEHLHEHFLNHFKATEDGGDGQQITVTGGGELKVMVDMWVDGDGTSGGYFDFGKYNHDGHTLESDLDSLNVSINGDTNPNASNFVYVWISDAEQLKGIQDFLSEENTKATEDEKDAFLRYNFALKDDIDATALAGFEAIGTGTDGFAGTFDGRGFRIIGLRAGDDGAQDNAGLFSKLTAKTDEGAAYSGTVRDLGIYASNFYGNITAGAVAGDVDEGATITGVTTFGNRVEAEHAGGIAGTNAGRIESSTASDSVITNGGTAGGVAGTNTGTIEGIAAGGDGGEDTFVTTNSAVTFDGVASAIGGVAGENKGTINLANSLGVTNGANVDDIGGVAGVNSGTMHSLYNESIVTGQNNVGGVAGTNGGSITNAVNTTDITATGELAGGIAGVNSGGIDSGRNTGIVNGTNSVGGMVGANEKGGILENLSNAVTAAIFGGTNVGGIAGTNSGTITSDNNLVNEGTVSGNQFVGGIAGVNRGTIKNVKSDTLVLDADGNNPTYFGGIAGQNNGTITNATNDSSVEADGAEYVGGIVGENTTIGKLIGEFVNNGSVLGRSSVGGLVGKNSNKNLLVGNTDENGEITRLQVTNNGTVETTDGTAAGIVYEHDGNIMHADLINTGEVKGNTGGTAGGGAEHGSGGLFGIVKEGSIISDAALINRGTVTVTEGDTSSTGGVIGINHGKITNSSLINETAGGEGGVVEGGENTGGLMGKNTGDITYSSLINRVGAEVSGTENVGGLIGYNIGKIEGGRKETENGKYYAYQIYNNGEVNGTNNVGGLIGHNADGGALYAGYNTGAVKGNDSVGGIAGRNDGSVSSVFNTIMTGLNEDGTTKYGAVTGKTNVGGLVGSNTGKLTNAYNTTTVESGGTKGNIAGSNSGEVENVYATNNDKNGMLIGTGNGTVTNGYNYDETKKDSASYEGFFEDGNDAWRIYEGYSTPLLRVFLTDAKYEGSTNQFTYNANMQGIKDLQKVTAADGLNGSQISSIAEVLLTALEQKNAGTDYLAFSSTQIAANNSEEGFNPNNLGYDIDATFSIGKLLLSVKDIIASIVYGGSKYEVTGGVLEGVIEGDSVDIDVDFADMSKEELDKLIVEGSEHDKSKGGRATADVLYGDDGKVAAYENSLLYNGSLSLTGNDADNYALAEDTTVGGSITVEKAKLNVELGTVERTYGNTGLTTEGGYKVTDSFKQHLVNGDKNLGYAVSNFNVTVAENGDTALTGVSTGRVTKDANLENESYYWTAEKVSGVNGETLTNLSKNYDIIVNGQGKSIVNKAPLSITLNDVTRIYGEAETFVGGIGYGIDSVDGLVNGDEDYENALKLIDGAFENELIADSGLLPNGWTNDANDNNDEKPNYTWTVKDNNINAFEGIDKLSQNYTLTVNKGESFVEKLALTISDVFATIVYGDQNGTGFKIAEGGKLTGIVYDDDVSLSKELKIEDAEFAAGGSYESSRNGRTTADAGIYDNETLTFSDLTLSGTKAGNYTLNKDVEGDIVVKKAVLTLTPDNATTTYGTAFDENSYSYTLSGVTNDDEENALRTAIGVLEYGNDAAFYGEGGKYTADAATHNNAVYIKNLNEKMLTNYNVVGDKGAAIITKATLDVALNPVERTYGDTTLTHGDYSINTDWLDKLVNGDELMYTGDEISISGIISDKAVIDEYTTNDAGGHSWSAKVNTSALAQNYNINEIAIGSSIVNKAKLTVNAGHAETTYGTPFDKNKYYYDLVGVTNGDAESEIKAQIGNVAYDNTAAIEDGGDRVTDNAGVNGVLSILTDLFGIELGNYEIEKVNDGTATVEKADLFITAHDKHTHVGREPEYTGTTLGELELVNGDTLADFSYTFGIEEASMLDEAGHYAGTIAAVVDGQYYYDGTHDWSAHHDVFANYKVNVEAGNLTVVRLMPTIPHYNYSWLYDDAPYGRKWNFRERKAEIYFQDGGMAYDENM